MTTLEEHIERGTLIRRAWTGTDNQGRDTACILSSLSPEVAREHSTYACPASVMPAWLAHLTPWINDSGTAGAWPGVVRRYAAIARRWHVLDGAAWQRLDYRVRAICVREAMRHTTHAAALQACERVATLCEGVADGGPVDDEAFAAWAAAAEVAAVAAAWAEAESEAEVAWAAARVAEAVAAAEAKAESEAEVAWAAARVAEAVAAAEAEVVVARVAAAATVSADRMIDQMLTAIEGAVYGG